MSKVSFGKNQKQSKTARVSLKVTELEDLDITEEEPEIKILYGIDQITIKKKGK